MTERNRSSCEYVHILTYHVGSTGASSRWAEFFREANAKVREISNVASGNTQANILQEGGAGFKAAIYLKKEECIKELSTQT
jgi:hypothetical protein